jgi:hypothetical protein
MEKMTDAGISASDGKHDEDMLMDHVHGATIKAAQMGDVKGFRDGLKAIIAHHMAYGESDFEPENDEFISGGKD